MNFNDIRIFVTVVNSGSFTMAADQLMLSKQFVSRRITELEREVATRLLVRNTRSLSVTDAGQAFYQHALRILEEVYNAEQTMSLRQHTLVGSFKISLPMTYGVNHLSPIIAEFQYQHPDLKFHIDLSDRYVDLISEGFDMVLRIGDLLDSSLIARKLAQLPMVLCASPAYLKKEGVPKRIDDLLDHQCLLYGREGQYGWRVTVDGKPHILAVRGSLTSNNGEIIRNGAIAGLGIALMPEFIVRDALELNQLQTISLPCELPELTLNAVYPQHRQHSAMTRAFLDFLSTKIAQTH